MAKIAWDIIVESTQPTIYSGVRCLFLWYYIYSWPLLPFEQPLFGIFEVWLVDVSLVHKGNVAKAARIQASFDVKAVYCGLLLTSVQRGFSCFSGELILGLAGRRY